MSGARAHESERGVGELAANDITTLLDGVRRGDGSAAERLLELLYDDLRRLARRRMRDAPADLTLQPTALVHEAFLRIFGPGEVRIDSRAHFFALAACAMRQILTDEARRRGAAKRGRGWDRIDLSEVEAPGDPDGQLRALDEALAELTASSPRLGGVARMRFLAGMTVEEVAEVSGVSVSTVERDWRFARAWLTSRLEEGGPS